MRMNYKAAKYIMKKVCFFYIKSNITEDDQGFNLKKKTR